MRIYNLSLKDETPCSGYWDYAMVDDLIGRGEDVRSLPKSDRAIVKIPARHHADKVEEINKELRKIRHAVVFLLGDEEADFPVDDLKARYIWVQNPHPDKHDKYDRIGTGYTPHAIKVPYTPKDLTLYFSGQITHDRRKEMYKYAKPLTVEDDSVVVNRTKGFTQGLQPDEYIQQLARAKYCPCPSGAVIPDSFRVYECLQVMTIPIADEVNPTRSIEGYWDWLFQEVTPFPKLKHWGELKDRMNGEYDVFTITHWWLDWKQKFTEKVIRQYEA